LWLFSLFLTVLKKLFLTFFKITWLQIILMGFILLKILCNF
jgi:hypothetical protein